MAVKNPTSKDLKGALRRVKAGKLTGDDQKVLADLLDSAIKLRQLVEKARVSKGDKKVVVSLPFGFDIVK